MIVRPVPVSQQAQANWNLLLCPPPIPDVLSRVFGKILTCGPMDGEWGGWVARTENTLPIPLF